jgi:hypothetical protein
MRIQWGRLQFSQAFCLLRRARTFIGIVSGMRIQWGRHQFSQAFCLLRRARTFIGIDVEKSFNSQVSGSG